MLYVLSCCRDKHHEPKHLGEAGFTSSYNSQVTCLQTKKAGQEPKAGTDAEVMKKLCLLPHGLPGLLTYSPQDHQPRGGIITVGWTLWHLSLIKTMLQGMEKWLSG